MKNSGIKWIGEIPDDWEVIKTKNMFRNVKRIVGEQHWHCERLALTLNGVIKRNKDEADGLQPEKFDTYQFLYKNELVFKLIDLGNIATSRVGLSPFDGMVSPAYIILHNDCSDNRFYFYYYLSMWHRNIFNSLGDNGVRSSIGANDLLNLPIVDTNEAERIKIADFLDKKCAEIDYLIAHEEAMIDELKAYKQSVITEAVTKGLDRTAPMKNSGVEWIGEIPLSWQICKLTYVCSIITDFVASGSFSDLKNNVQYLDEPDYAMLVRTTDLSGSSRSENKVYINEDAYKFLNNSNLFGGEIILPNIGASCGDVYIVPILYEKMSLAPNAIMFKTKYNDKYFYYFFKSKCGREMLQDLCASTAQQKFNKTELRLLRVPLVPLAEQDIIVSFLDKRCAAIDSLQSIKQQKIDELKAYKKSLIYEYVTGKKEVC